MVRALAFLMLAALTCVATVGCGNSGPPVVPEDASDAPTSTPIEMGGEGTPSTSMTVPE